MRSGSSAVNVFRDLDQALLFGGAERRLAHDDGTDNRLPRSVTAGRAFIELALEDFLVVDLFDQDRRLILGCPDRGRAAAGPAGLAIERHHRQERSDRRIGRRRRQRDLQDVAVVEQLGAFDDGEVGGVERQPVDQQRAGRDRDLHHGARARLGGGRDQALDRHADRRVLGRIKPPATQANCHCAGEGHGKAREVGGGDRSLNHAKSIRYTADRQCERWTSFAPSATAKPCPARRSSPLFAA
jgi:hypothetical protein